MAKTLPLLSLKTLFWLMLCVACFFGGMAWQRRQCKIKAEDWADMIYAQEEKHAWLVKEYKRHRRSEFQERQQLLVKRPVK